MKSKKPSITAKADPTAKKTPMSDDVPPLMSDSKDTSTPKTGADVTKAKSKADAAKVKMEAAHQKVRDALVAIQDVAKDPNNRIKHAKSTFNQLVGGGPDDKPIRTIGLNTMANVNGTPKANVEHAFKETQRLIERSVQQAQIANKDEKKALHDALMAAMAEAKTATVAYVEAKQEHGAAKEQSQKLSADFTFRAGASCAINEDATTLNDLLTTGDVILVTNAKGVEEEITINGDKISTKGHQVGGDVTAFTKVVIAKAKRNPDEPITLDGAQEDVLAVLRQLKKSGISNEIKLGPYIQNQQTFSFRRARHAAVRAYDRSKLGWGRNFRNDQQEIQSLLKSIPGKPQEYLQDSPDQAFNKNERNHITLENIFADNKGQDPKQTKKAQKAVQSALKMMIANDYTDSKNPKANMTELAELAVRCEDTPELGITQSDFTKNIPKDQKEKFETAYKEVSDKVNKADTKASTSKANGKPANKQDDGTTKSATDPKADHLNITPSFGSGGPSK